MASHIDKLLAENEGDPLEGNERYKKIKFLNRGAYGSVLLALDLHAVERNKSRSPKEKKELEEVAVKLLDRGTSINKYVEREILNQMKLVHHHVIQLKEILLTPRHLVLVMEYAAGGDLFHLVQKKGSLSEEDARWFFQQIICALDYCHKMGVSSRDIKLENTLLTNDPKPIIKLADFGFSKDEMQQSAPTSRVGTPAYLAPEVIICQVNQSYDAKLCDLWSCGVLLYVMVIGSYPFQENNSAHGKKVADVEKLLKKIVNVDYKFPEKKVLSAECKDMINGLLKKDPKKRFTVKQICGHPWFQSSRVKGSALIAFNDAEVEKQKVAPSREALITQIKQCVAQAQIKPETDDELIASTLDKFGIDDIPEI